MVQVVVEGKAFSHKVVCDWILTLQLWSCYHSNRGPWTWDLNLNLNLNILNSKLDCVGKTTRLAVHDVVHDSIGHIVDGIDDIVLQSKVDYQPQATLTSRKAF